MWGGQGTWLRVWWRAAEQDTGLRPHRKRVTIRGSLCFAISIIMLSTRNKVTKRPWMAHREAGRATTSHVGCQANTCCCSPHVGPPRAATGG